MINHLDSQFSMHQKNHVAYRLVTSISSVTSSATWRAKPNRPLSEPSTPGEISLWTDFPVGQWKEKYHFWKYSTLPKRTRKGNRHIDKIPWKNTIRNQYLIMKVDFVESLEPWLTSCHSKHIYSVEGKIENLWRRELPSNWFRKLNIWAMNWHWFRAPSTSWFQWPFLVLQLGFTEKHLEISAEVFQLRRQEESSFPLS